MLVEHPERPGELLYDGPTQLSFYVCVTEECRLFGQLRQIRESAETGKTVFPEARRCDGPHGCGKLRRRVRNTTVPE